MKSVVYARQRKRLSGNSEQDKHTRHGVHVTIAAHIEQPLDSNVDTEDVSN